MYSIAPPAQLFHDVENYHGLSLSVPDGIKLHSKHSSESLVSD